MKITNDVVPTLQELGHTDKGITLVSTEAEKKFISFKELWNRSYCLSQWLSQNGVTINSEVIIKCESLEFFLYTFWACAIGQFIAIPLDSSQNDPANNLLTYVLGKSDHPVIVTDIALAVNNNTTIIDISDLYEKIINCGDYLNAGYQTSPEDILYVLYSSGTTGMPHGVIIRKFNAIANSDGFINHYDINEQDRFLSWSPMTHCYGLVTFHLTPLLARAEHCLISAKLYMNQPLVWMDLIHEYQATRIGSLPFALKHFTNVYKNSNQQFDWNLTAVKSMFLGGEQVNFALFKEFCESIQKYGFTDDKVYPLYGLTEATIMVSANPINKKVKRFKVTNDKLVIGDRVRGEYIEEVNETDNIFLSMGTILKNMQVSIRNEEFCGLGDERLGQVCVSGPCISSGYYQDDEATKKVFVDTQWLCTGDVGFLYQGELYIIGREKELVVANGKKVSCALIESIIQENLCNSQFEQCAVCNGTRHENENEKVIVFIKTDFHYNDQNDIQAFLDFKSLLTALIFEKIGLTVSEVIPVDTIPKTTSGKAFRRKLTENYNSGTYNQLLDKINRTQPDTAIVSEATDQIGRIKNTKNTVLKAIVKIIEDSFHIIVTDYSVPFSEYGIVSINLPSFTAKLAGYFSVELNISDIFKCFNVVRLTDHIYSLLNITTDVHHIEEIPTVTIIDKIAIVGISCRLPGGADNVEKFWDLLYSGKDGICDVPESRWDLEKYYDEDESAPGKMYCHKGGFLEGDINEFDARFFNISPKEAQALDPQQRMLLELTWEAFENANIDITKYNGTDTGVYVGMSTNEYYMAQLHSGEMERIGSYALTGSCFSTACGRVSYTFGFEGPCISVDTACSSTLTALHLACTGLHAGEADLQVVAGINLIETPNTNIGFSKLQATSVDGHSKAFDASANGYGRSEGGGVILLKRLSDAVRDKDEILGIVRATGINQDGKSNGLTAPNGEAQEKLIRRTLSNAGLNALDVDYVEMHGTGTKLGDPIEVHAVAATYGRGRNKDNLLKIGSVKSNIGHLEASAGISSIIKVLLSMKHKLIPANLHFHTPNPFINWADANVEVVSTHTPWEKENGLKVAAINGFGFGGSNAHVIIEEYQATKGLDEELAVRSGIDYVLKLSAKSEKSLKALVQQYHQLLIAGGDRDFENVIYTANIVRADLDFRFAVCGDSRQMILERMAGYLKDSYAEGVFCNIGNPVLLQKDRKVAMMFSGQGSQYVKMGKLLYETNPVFRTAFDQCDKLFKPYLLCSISDLIYGNNSEEQKIAKTVYAQPLIFAIEYALYQMWEDYGVKPELVMGHSIGEYSAAVAAGILSLEDAIKMVSVRSRLMDMAPGQGSMATIFADRDQVEDFLHGYESSVCIAARNAKETCVISGIAGDVETVSARAREAGITVKELKVSHGFHSMLMEPILKEFQLIADEITFRSPQVRFISALYGKEIESEQLLDSEYWTRHIREEVDFYRAVSSIEKRENLLLLEVGSSRILAALSKLIFEEERVIAATLNIKKADQVQLTESIALLYSAGVNLNWNNIVFAGHVNWKRIKLPNYPYDKDRYWMELKYDRETEMVSSDDYHKILGQKIDLSHLNNGVIFQNKFTATEPYFMKEHVIFNTAISPAAAHLAMLISGIEKTEKVNSCTFSEIEFRAPLAVNREEERMVQLCIKTRSESPGFSIHSRDFHSAHDKWLLHAKGRLSTQSEYKFTELKADIQAYQRLSYQDDMEENGVYYAMRNSGFELGDGFRRIKQVSFNREDCICIVEPLKRISHLNEYVLYPGTIDSVLQTGFAFVLENLKNDETFKKGEMTVIPYYLGSFTYNYRSSDRLWCQTKSRLENDIIYVDAVVYNDQGEVVIKIDNLMAKITDSDSLLREMKSLDKMYYHTEWEVMGKLKKIAPSSLEQIHLIIHDHSQAGEFLAAGMRKAGLTPILINFYTMAPEQPKDWLECFNQSGLAGDSKSLNIIFYTASGLTDGPEVNRCPVKALFTLVKMLGERGNSQHSKIRIMTKGVQPYANSGSLNLSGALVWGLAKVISIEYPEFYGGIIDCDQSIFTSDAGFIEELLNLPELEVCIRDQLLYTARLISHTDYLRCSPVQPREIVVRDAACYLITGGTGTVGLSYASQLAQAGAKYLLLMCRKEPGAKALKVIDELQKKGIEVSIVFADVCDYQSLKTALEEYQIGHPPVRGVVHAAGVINDKMMMNADWSDFEQVIDPKVNGSMYLYQLLAKESLDFFMMTSSITSMIGNMGQANYAAANYFMNIFASYLNSNHIPGYTFCWGPWSSSGMAADNDSATASMERMGMKAFVKGQSEKIIEDFIKEPYENLVIVEADWNILNQSFKHAPGKNTFLSKLISPKEISDNQVQEVQVDRMSETLKTLSMEERKDFLLVELRKICGKIMGFKDVNQMSADVALREQGADSLMTFSMRTEINKLFGIDLNISAFFNYPTITKLVEHLLTDVLIFENQPAVVEVQEEIPNSVDDILLEIAELTISSEEQK